MGVHVLAGWCEEDERGAEAGGEFGDDGAEHAFSGLHGEEDGEGFG